ncbi:hypothetical protein [Phaeodactylibacter luteus]|uniref:Uncharacterized protein n=1 Tax=Phaeodactylibacter luteus TaxID=1564516 RepID=A0A5C6RL45_9BACT|nr:hypothetical protein [Phaeodactylibacter luteus]TXB62674.1 hypothetical protein FRY97_13110 [Phaeodactylibacter luteus]
MGKRTTNWGESACISELQGIKNKRMGHWGPAIFSNDTSADIKDEFNSLFNKETPIDKIKEQIISSFKEGENLEENTDLWLSLSFLMWQVGYEDDEVKKKAFKIIDNGIDLKVWKESDADKQTLSKRRKKLSELRDKISNHNPQPRKPRIRKPPKSKFNKGDCYAYPLKNGNYTGIVILEEILDPEYYFVLIAQTNVNLNRLPTLDEIIESDILIEQPHQGLNSNHRKSISSYTNSKYKEIVKTFEKIGTVEIKDDFSKNYLSFGAAPWNFLVDRANEYLVDGKESPKVKWKTKNYIKMKNTQKKNSIWNIFKKKKK